MFVAGDSAGGGLSLALTLQLKAHGKTQPKAAGLLSLMDRHPAAKVPAPAERDPMIDINREGDCVLLQQHPADDPLISPVFADLAGLAPLLSKLHKEVLFDDANALSSTRSRRNKAELQIWDDMSHVHQIAFRMVPEARAAPKTLRGFQGRNGQTLRHGIAH